jgi:SAM-dependent methyltransferase
LQTEARNVTGVDVDPEAIAQARSETGETSAVLLGNGLGLPFEDETFDVVTSFETLEHLHERAAFLAELRRVLRTNGRLILSTPNALYTRPVEGIPVNPFHIYEYEPAELRTELKRHFSVEIMVGQRLDPAIKIPPFYESQRRLPSDPGTQIRLLGWKIFNKLPFALREKVSETIWNKPFYPTEKDYEFSEVVLFSAPVSVAVCRKG